MRKLIALALVAVLGAVAIACEVDDPTPTPSHADAPNIDTGGPSPSTQARRADPVIWEHPTLDLWCVIKVDTGLDCFIGEMPDAR